MSDCRTSLLRLPISYSLAWLIRCIWLKSPLNYTFSATFAGYPGDLSRAIPGVGDELSTPVMGFPRAGKAEKTVKNLKRLAELLKRCTFNNFRQKVIRHRTFMECWWSFRSVTFDCPSKYATINSPQVPHLGELLPPTTPTESHSEFPGGRSLRSFHQLALTASPSACSFAACGSPRALSVSHLRPASDFDCLPGPSPSPHPVLSPKDTAPAGS